MTCGIFSVVLLKQNYRLDDLGNRTTHYYQSESVGPTKYSRSTNMCKYFSRVFDFALGIAAGMFVSALHNANLATLTSTPMVGSKVDWRRDVTLHFV